MKIIILLILIIILFYVSQKNRELFTLSIGRYIRFMKEKKFDDTLSKKDLQLINNIQNCYSNLNTYYPCINKLDIPYLRNPKPNKQFKKEINYKKYQDPKHLLPYNHDFDR